MKKFKKTLITIILICALIYILPNLFSPLIKAKISNALENYWMTKFDIKDIYISLFTGTVTLQQLTMKNTLPDKQDYLFSAKRISLKPNIPSLFTATPTIKKITIDSPQLNLYQTDHTSNWDFLWSQGPWQKNQPVSKTPLILEEMLLKDGRFTYQKDYPDNRTARAETTAIFIYLTRENYPRAHIAAAPLSSTIKGRANIPARNSGKVNFHGAINLEKPHTNFILNLNLEKIPLTYFSDFKNPNSPVEIKQGTFNLESKITCANDTLEANPNVTVENLRFQLNPGQETQNIFGLQAALVTKFFDLHKDKFEFNFTISGTLAEPEFLLGDILKEKISAIIGESIIKSILNQPKLILKLGKMINKLGLKTFKQIVPGLNHQPENDTATD